MEGIPVDLIEVLGNLIRKTAYTQLSAKRLVGLGISEDADGNVMCLSTSPVESTTTVLDVIIKLVDCKLNGSISTDGNNSKNTQVTIYEKPFTDLKEALSEYIDVTGLPNDLLITNKQHVLKLAFMQVDHDMGANELQTFMPEGLTPIPCSVLTSFKLDYSQKDSGLLSFEISDEFEEGLKNALLELRDHLIIS